MKNSDEGLCIEQNLYRNVKQRVRHGYETLHSLETTMTLFTYRFLHPANAKCRVVVALI